MRGAGTQERAFFFGWRPPEESAGGVHRTDYGESDAAGEGGGESTE